MQIRSFRGSGEPVWVSALPSAGFRLGPDPRRALGPAANLAASTGRTRDRTRPMLQNVRKFLPGRRPHVTQSGHLATKQFVRHLVGSGRVAHALETMRNGCISSRLLALGDPRREHNFKVIRALPMPSSATLPNAAIKYRLSQEKPSVDRRQRRSAATPSPSHKS